MFKAIRSFVSELLNTGKHVRDTLRYASEGKVAETLTSYAKSIPGAIVIGKYGKPLVDAIAKATLSPKLSSAVSAVTPGIKSVTNWWLTPAKSVGLAAKKTATAIPKAAVKSVAVSGAKAVAAVAGAVTVNHAVSRLANHASWLDMMTAIFAPGKATEKQKELVKKKNSIIEYVNSSWILKAIGRKTIELQEWKDRFSIPGRP